MTSSLASNQQQPSRRKGAPDSGAVERELARRIAAGEDRAVAELFDLVGTTLYALALGITHDSVQAEEAVEETFAELWEGRQVLEHLPALSPWLVGRCRQRALGLLTGQRLPPATIPGDPAGDRLALRLLGCPSRLRRSRVTGALGRLDPRERQVVELAHRDGLGVMEIAHRIRVQTDQVHTLLRTGLRAFRSALEGSLRRES